MVERALAHSTSQTVCLFVHPITCLRLPLAHHRPVPPPTLPLFLNLDAHAHLTQVEGFATSTRTLERRKMDPFADINSFQGNAHSAKSVLDHSAHVRPLDVKGQLGAGPVQRWKETLREDFANDNDNASSNMHDAMLDALRNAMGSQSSFSTIQ